MLKWKIECGQYSKEMFHFHVSRVTLNFEKQINIGLKCVAYRMDREKKNLLMFTAKEKPLLA